MKRTEGYLIIGQLAKFATPLLTFNTYARARQPRLKEISEKVGVEIGACANGVQQDNEDETKEGEKPLNNNTYKENKVAERAGFEPESKDDNRIAGCGQQGSICGQKLSNAGQLLGLASKPNVEERTGNGQLESMAGQDFAPKWPQNESARLLAVSKQTLLSELQEVAEAWEELPQPLKDGILAIVRGLAK